MHYGTALADTGQEKIVTGLAYECIITTNLMHAHVYEKIGRWYI